MRLYELKQLYGDSTFILGQYNEEHKVTIIPKEVTIKEDLTVWHDGACIINGMRDKDFFHSKSDFKFVKSKIVESIDKDSSLSYDQSKHLKSFLMKKKRL